VLMHKVNKDGMGDNTQYQSKAML